MDEMIKINLSAFHVNLISLVHYFLEDIKKYNIIKYINIQIFYYFVNFTWISINYDNIHYYIFVIRVIKSKTGDYLKNYHEHYLKKFFFWYYYTISKSN